MNEVHESYKYRGFISYAAKDEAIAKRFHAVLERFQIPTTDGKAAIGKFFLAPEDLGATAESKKEILKSAIHQSQDLIVICSRASAESIWVNFEVEQFREKSSNRIYAVIVDNAENLDCFCPALKEADPIAPDLTKESFSRVIAKLVSGLIGVDFDQIWDREARRKRNKYSVICITALFFVLMAGFGLHQFAGSQKVQQEAARKSRLFGDVNRYTADIADGTLDPTDPHFLKELLGIMPSLWVSGEFNSEIEVFLNWISLNQPAVRIPLGCIGKGGFSSGQDIVASNDKDLSTTITCNSHLLRFDRLGLPLERRFVEDRQVADGKNRQFLSESGRWWLFLQLSQGFGSELDNMTVFDTVENEWIDIALHARLSEVPKLRMSGVGFSTGFTILPINNLGAHLNYNAYDTLSMRIENDGSLLFGQDLTPRSSYAFQYKSNSHGLNRSYLEPINDPSGKEAEIRRVEIENLPPSMGSHLNYSTSEQVNNSNVLRRPEDRHASLRPYAMVSTPARTWQFLPRVPKQCHEEELKEIETQNGGGFASESLLIDLPKLVGERISPSIVGLPDEGFERYATKLQGTFFVFTTGEAETGRLCFILDENPRDLATVLFLRTIPLLPPRWNKTETEILAFEPASANAGLAQRVFLRIEEIRTTGVAKQRAEDLLDHLIDVMLLEIEWVNKEKFFAISFSPSAKKTPGITTWQTIRRDDPNYYLHLSIYRMNLVSYLQEIVGSGRVVEELTRRDSGILEKFRESIPEIDEDTFPYYWPSPEWQRCVGQLSCSRSQ